MSMSRKGRQRGGLAQPEDEDIMAMTSPLLRKQTSHLVGPPIRAFKDDFSAKSGLAFPNQLD